MLEKIKENELFDTEIWCKGCCGIKVAVITLKTPSIMMDVRGEQIGYNVQVV